MTRPGEQLDEEQPVWEGGEIAPSNIGWGVSRGNFFTSLLLGIMGQNQPAPPLVCIFTPGEGHHEFGAGLGSLRCLSLLLRAPQTDAVIPVLPSCF